MIIFPKEHGSWAILLIPFLMGAKIGGGFDIKIVLFLVSVLSIFLAYQPALMLAKLRLKISSENVKDALKSFLVFLPFAVLPSLVLIFYFKLYGLLLFGLIGLIAFFLQLYLAKLNLDKTQGGQLFAMSVLVMTAPSAYYVGIGRFDLIMLQLYFLNLIFFGSGIVYVRMKISALATKKEKFTLSEKLFIGRYNIAYHVAILILISALFAFNSVGLLTFLGFLPVIIHSIMGTFMLERKVKFKKLGWIETVYSILFAIMVIIEFSRNLPK
ncbi:YwiC-like protein [Candidatus Kryptonium thompsonii]|uniref:YwiC-like protein n=4 Tax=Candidatus Kryptonium thompsonii TaxID=1633631 RepID=A0A0P1M862_9BACT|nr:YwiC-like family protein [Candidatus Kryptonium thompsoni]CUS76814.1 YwiC-like protein [Candidatus Kryptonium thompsoni]CUS80494.1 YwiC-like protein [Candidatus Kryptonium thompsoni]CUS91142.1 YwiC-like protein [Candidatus Kryptonium thompsoni]CUS93458.1 YwiC-like protein [Candidatus Kryptonium thompsoni]CUT05636.1 YwiC-like protein [Candidatus Kryptonium thompsoni]